MRSSVTGSHRTRTVGDQATVHLDWYKRRGFVENNSGDERNRMAQDASDRGFEATSVRLDLDRDPRVHLER